jgi:hypothetical protein
LDDGETFVITEQEQLLLAIDDMLTRSSTSISTNLLWVSTRAKDALFNALKDDPKGSLDSSLDTGIPTRWGQEGGPFCRYLRESVAYSVTDELRKTTLGLVRAETQRHAEGRRK